MVDTGFVLAGTGANDTGIGTVAWSNPGNITASDNTDASFSTGSAVVSNYIKGTNNGISVPAGATIDGIETQIEGDKSLVNITVTSVKCVRSGTIEGTDNQDGAAWPDNDALKALGGAADLWGLTWTVAQVNASTTGHVWSGTTTGGNVVNVDAMWRKVYYTEGGGNLSINKSESITVADSPTVRLNPLLFNVSDSVTVADSPTVSIPGGPLEINASDSIVVIDTPLVIFSAPQISVSDTITVGESTTINVVLMPSVADAVSLADSVTMNLIVMPNVSEAITISESVRVHVLLFISVNDAVTVADSPTVSVVAVSNLQINVSDSVTLAEFISVTGPSLVASESFVGERWKASVNRRKKGMR